MSNILEQKVLLLNASWSPIEVINVKKILEDMNSSRHPKKALKIEYLLEKGVPDYTSPTEVIPLDWEEWITLSPRPYDEHSIRTISMEIRVPTVAIVGSNYNRMPIKTFRPTKRNLYNRYAGRCVWTGEVIPYKSATVEHMIPRSRGGKNGWDNLAIASPDLNRKKGARTPEEFGVKPKYALKAPSAVTVKTMIRALNPDWAIFLKNQENERE